MPTLGDNFSGGGGGTFHPQPHASATSWNGQIQVDDRIGQAFTALGGILDKVVLPLGDFRVDTDGTAYVRVYTHQGTFGTSSEPLNAADAADTPTPNWLAISDGVVFLGVEASADYDFVFSGANRIQLTANAKYVLVLDWIPNDRVTNNTFGCGGDVLNSGTLHGGNLYDDGFAAANNGVHATWDMHFAVWEAVNELDTRSKRASSVRILKPWMPALVLPDSTLDQGDRQHSAWTYSGILAGSLSGSPGAVFASPIFASRVVRGPMPC